jgi:flavin-dependent dehydrogenase
MPSAYDAVVIGAGPAGSMAAHEIASAGQSVLLLEKHKRPGLPLCCAEAVSRPSFDKIMAPEPQWISTEIERVLMVSPGGEKANILHPRAGYVLDRVTFDNDLARRAAEAGADLRCEAIGIELNGTDQRF